MLKTEVLELKIFQLYYENFYNNIVIVLVLNLNIVKIKKAIKRLELKI